MGTRRRKVDASARQPTAPGKQAFFFFLVPRRSLTTHISNSTRQPSQAAGALFEKLADAARGHRPPRAAPDPPMQPIVLGKRARAPEARKAPAPATGDRRCAHGRANGGYLCRECPGKGICEHGRQRSHCKECGGSSYCEHGRQRHKCKECGGSSICEHGRERRRCKACWASQVCEHGRVRSVCEECRGGCVCEHGRRRSKCKECEASQICEHGRQRDTCKACKGSRTGPGEAVRRWRWPGDVAKDWNRCLHGYTRQTCCACAPREFPRFFSKD